MVKDVLVILMMAVGLFAILMFILLYVYARKYYNEKHLNENIDDDQIENNSSQVEEDKSKGEVKPSVDEEIDFVPKKKKK